MAALVAMLSEVPRTAGKPRLPASRCVGEVYVASWKRGQQPRLAPTRISSSAVPRPPVSDDGRWRELCD